MKLILNLISIFLLFLAPEILKADGIIDLPVVVRDAIKKVEKSIVSIENFGGMLDSSIKEVGGEKKKISGFAKPGEGPTTGIIISKDGYIITSTFNFLLAPRIITVSLADGRKFNAKLLGKDLTRKICVLKIEGVEDLPVPEFVASEEVNVGQWSVSVGKGFGGLRQSLSLGIISGKNRIFGKALQTDSNISPANYGGPLIDINGRVIGVCTPLTPMQGGAMAGVDWYDSGIGFVISIIDNSQILERLKKGELIEPGVLGIHPFVSKEHPDKIMVDLVTLVSPAEKAGILPGDQIVRINDEVVDGLIKMKLILKKFDAGSAITCELLRSGKKIIVNVILASEREVFKPESLEELD